MTTHVSTGDAKTCPLQQNTSLMKLLKEEAYAQTHLAGWTLDSMTPQDATSAEYVMYNSDHDRTLHLLVNTQKNFIEDVWEF
jgi:hypothetical protein